MREKEACKKNFIKPKKKEGNKCDALNHSKQSKRMKHKAM